MLSITAKATAPRIPLQGLSVSIQKTPAALASYVKSMLVSRYGVSELKAVEHDLTMAASIIVLTMLVPACLERHDHLLLAAGAANGPHRLIGKIDRNFMSGQHSM